MTATTVAPIVRLAGTTIFAASIKDRLVRVIRRPLAGRTLRVEAELVHQLFNSREKRLPLPTFDEDEEAQPAITKSAMKTTRPRVNFFMNKFRKLGFIDYNRSLSSSHAAGHRLARDQPQIKHYTPATGARCATDRSPTLH
ncbi:hypothetical protein [Chelatococcus reniformis]|uniref:hypothetical protein n=1 Tax=Chelatococcus reniformis TaxID=1494448 RepID=UPI001665AA0B|nr:hypothetical protein [Chelatococcus reniformis]